MDIKKKYQIDVTVNPQDFGGAIGLPPQSYITKDFQKLGYPVVELTPCIPSPSSNLDVFRLDTSAGGESYRKRLDAYGVKLAHSTVDIPFAFLPEGSLVDTLSNDYGETFLQKATDVTGEGFGEMSQIFGGKSVDEVQSNMQKFAQPFKEELDKGGAISKTAGMFVGAGQEALGAVGAMSKSSAMQNSKFGQVLEKLATGHRFDFPMVWRNSGFTQNYSLTIRLYNPNPSSQSAHRKYILGPLTLLMVLGLPSSDKAFGFTWPFFIQMRSPGLFAIPAAAITNMTINKGGDQFQASWVGPRVSTIDIRIDFVSLYGTLIDDGLAPDASVTPDKPNLAMYLASLDNESTWSGQRGRASAETDPQGLSENMLMASINERAMNQATVGGEDSAYARAVGEDGAYARTGAIPNQKTYDTLEMQKEAMLAKRYSKTQDITFETDSRIPQDQVDLTASLKNQQPVFYGERDEVA